jgi:hypothetical protein
MGLVTADLPISGRGYACFYCGHTIDRDVHVYWIGTTTEGAGITIFLHPECVLDLCIRLMSDAHKFEVHAHKHVEFAKGFDKPG